MNNINKDDINYSKHISFIADVMLGSLAKWLRLFGNDVKYFRYIQDKDLVDFASKEKRIVLTRDTRMILRKEFQRGWIDYVLINHNCLPDQIRQVYSEYKEIKKAVKFTRCTVCNSILIDKPKESVKGKVPEYVYDTQDRFIYCCNCQKFFWPGTHWEKIIKTRNFLLKEKSMSAI